MATLAQLRDQLAACQKAREDVKRNEGRSLAEAEKKARFIGDTLLKDNLAHAEKMQDIQRQYDSLMQEALAKKSADVGRAKMEQANAEARQRAAEEAICTAEERAKVLQAQSRDLHMLLDHTDCSSASRQADCRKTAEEAVKTKNTGASKRVKEISNYAKEIQTSAFSATDALQDDHHDALTAIDDKSLQRSRFHELKDLSIAKDCSSMSQKEHRQAKEDLLCTWHKEWIDNTNSSTTLTNGRVSRVRALVSAGSHLAKPAVPSLVGSQALRVEEN